MTKTWTKPVCYVALAAACFQLAYSGAFPCVGLLIFGYAFALFKLTDQPTVRRAFYFGLAAGFLCGAPQLAFFWKIFNAAAIVLWIVFAFWIGLFTAVACGCRRRWGNKAVWLIPVVWTGLEYFRSELYYLKFSWLNIGYALPPALDSLGMYGAGFLAFAVVTIPFGKSSTIWERIGRFAFVLIISAMFISVSRVLTAARSETPNPPISITGIQMEFPGESMLPKALDRALAKDTNAQILVLSEYTLDGGVPDSLKNWCQKHSRYVVVGGKDVITNDVYYNTAFVVGTNGQVIFKQAKCVPIQFFHDGLPAPRQQLWDSPWGKIGLCICYDLSCTRVTDELVRQGAQLLIVPTMDVEEWGRHEHALHARVAPVRAAEYGIPIFRLASSGVSQAVRGNGEVIAHTSFGTTAEVLTARIKLPMNGKLPPDRILAPACTIATALLTLALLFRNWKEHRNKSTKD